MPIIEDPRTSWWRRILSDGGKFRSVSVENYQNLCGRIPTSGSDRTRAGFVQIFPDFAGFSRIPTKSDDIRTGIRPQGLLVLGFCIELLKLLRDANVCKSHSKRFISLIQSVLPIPNNFPSTFESLLSLLNIEDLFMKRSVCLICKNDINFNEKKC